jgi:hypothetical protein
MSIRGNEHEQKSTSLVFFSFFLFFSSYILISFIQIYVENNLYTTPYHPCHLHVSIILYFNSTSVVLYSFALRPICCCWCCYSSILLYYHLSFMNVYGTFCVVYISFLFCMPCVVLHPSYMLWVLCVYPLVLIVSFSIYLYFTLYTHTLPRVERSILLVVALISHTHRIKICTFVFCFCARNILMLLSFFAFF